MNISNVKKINFKGLWSVQDPIKQGETKKRQGIIIQEAVYHPFSDETTKEIERTLAWKKARTIHAIYNYSSRYNIAQKPNNFVIVKTSLGKPLSITKRQYSELKGLEKTPYPASNSSQCCIEVKVPDKEIQEILDKTK